MLFVLLVACFPCMMRNMEKCKRHQTVKTCPGCVGEKRMRALNESMTTADKSERGRKAAAARWKKSPTGTEIKEAITAAR